MDAGAVAAVIGGSVVGVVGVIYTLVRLFKAPAKPFNGETKEIVSLLRDIRDRLVGEGYAQSKLTDCAIRIEQSQQALHRRFDDVIDAVKATK